jgi:hypothetical protein
MMKCLFNDSPLSSRTKVEHTIPRNIGGRIRSRKVSSNRFNELCGNHIDNFVKASFAPLLAELAPLLSAEHRPGEIAIDIPNEVGRYVLDNGVLTQKDISIIETDDAGRPKTLKGCNRPAMIQKYRQAQGDSSYVMLNSPASEQTIGRIKTPLFNSRMELSLLKSALLSFDYFLSADRRNNFVRSPELLNLRQCINESVEKNVVDIHISSEIVMGVQFQNLRMYDDIRQRIAFPKTPFEHILICCGNPSTRTIDLVFNCFGFEPYSFRLCSNWRGEPFTLCIINGVVAGSGYTFKYLPGDTMTLGRQNMLRSVRINNARPDKHTLEVFTRNRGTAVQDAFLLVENTCDSHIAEMLVEGAENRDMQFWHEAVALRLQRLSACQTDEDETLSGTNNLTRTWRESLPRTRRSERLSDLSVDVSFWLKQYRKLLKGMIELFGKPEVLFSFGITERQESEK